MVARNFEVTIAGETRTVEAMNYAGDSRYITGEIALMRIGKGAKLHPTRITIWTKEDGSYRVDTSATKLNRVGRIVAWNTDEWERIKSRHNGDR